MSTAVKITRVDHTPNQIRAIAARSEDGGQARRLLAVTLVLEGTSRVDAGRQTGMDRQTVRDWVHRFNERGVDGLIARKPQGPEAKTDARATVGTAPDRAEGSGPQGAPGRGDRLDAVPNG